MSKECFIRFRVSAEEKAAFAEQAAEIGATESDLARSMIFAKDKLIFLSGGSDIVTQLYSLSQKLEKATDSGHIPVETLVEMKRDLGEITAALCDIAQYTAELVKDEECET